MAYIHASNYNKQLYVNLKRLTQILYMIGITTLQLQQKCAFCMVTIVYSYIRFISPSRYESLIVILYIFPITQTKTMEKNCIYHIYF